MNSCNMETGRPPARGRAASLVATIRQIQESRPGLEEPVKEVPKPRGRAARLQEACRQETIQIGSSSSSELSLESGSSTTPSTSSISGPSNTSTHSPVASVTGQIDKVAICKPKPSPGTNGKAVPATANYIQIHTTKGYGVFVYEVCYDPMVDAKSLRSRLLYNELRRLDMVLMFDGGSCLYSPTLLQPQNLKFIVPHPNEDYDITITLIFKKETDTTDCIHLYNVLFKRVMHALLYSRIGRNYYDSRHKNIIPQRRLEIFPGYAVNAAKYDCGFLLCLDTQHRVLSTKSVLDRLVEIKNFSNDNFKVDAVKILVGSSILTKYNNKLYTINDILWEQNPHSTFPNRVGGDITYLEYYKKQYDIVIKDKTQPLLLNRELVKKPREGGTEDRIVCLIPELCCLTGISDEMRSDFQVMKDIAQFTRVTPTQRVAALKTYLQNVQSSPAAQKILSEWGVTIAEATVDLQMRILDPEIILFGNNMKHTAVGGDWTGAMSKNKVIGPVDIENWIIFYTSRDSDIVPVFCDQMQRVSSGMGIRISKPSLRLLKDDYTKTYFNQLLALKAQETPQIIVFICPTLREDRYSTIKKLCTTDYPIPSQVILGKTLRRPKQLRTITQKIALQMNCKLGGTLWTIRFPFQKWMICGIDVYHSPKQNRSVYGFVGSLNESISKWFSISVFQEKEIGDHLVVLFTKSLEAYRAENGYFPSVVVVYRDGVGDGQIAYCRDYEVPQFEKCMKSFGIINAQIIYIIVQKRINTRIFFNNNGTYVNPPPGSVVDTSITKLNLYDFYLVPQHVNQGTVTPTHYIVVKDTYNLKPDHVQKLSYKLCHLYYNWTGTIRVPAPCQYAHKLCSLIGEHVKKTPDNSLNNILYYL